jgi:protein-disulfide isomerase
MYQLTSLLILALAAAQRITASTPSAGVDISNVAGNAYLVLNASATEGATQTADFKLQHCDTQGGTYTDTGITFTQVTNAAPSMQKVLANTDGLKKFVRVMPTLGGTSPAVTYSLQVIGKAHA